MSFLADKCKSRRAAAVLEILSVRFSSYFPNNGHVLRV